MPSRPALPATPNYRRTVIEERRPTAKANAQQMVRIGWKETELSEAVKAGGGSWLPEKKLWHVPTRTIPQLRIQNRVVKESA